jgi:hypothetical protein
LLLPYLVGSLKLSRPDHYIVAESLGTRRRARCQPPATDMVKARGVIERNDLVNPYLNWAGRPQKEFRMEIHRLRVDALMGTAQLLTCEEAVRGEAGGGDGGLSHEDGLGCARGMVVCAVLEILALSAGAMCLGLYWLLR